MNIKNKLNQFNQELEVYGSKLIVVSKEKPKELIQESYESGQRDFGENKIQELIAKYEQLPKDIQWHMIGHLQRNKVKYIIPFVHLIHGVDSERLLVAINKEAKKCNRIINCLLQIHIADESTKFGFNVDELNNFLSSNRINTLQNINIIGFMGIATNTNNKEQIRNEFEGLKKLYESIKSNYHFENLKLKELSMGMSGDYKIAIKVGSTMVRIGSSILGVRN